MHTHQPSPVTPNVAQSRSIFERILVPIDFSMASQRALGAALELRRQYGSRVCVFHVSESSTHDEFLGGLGGAKQGKGEAEGRLHRFLENVAPGAAGELEIRTQVGAEIEAAIAEEAQAFRATLVVLPETRTTFGRSRSEKAVRKLAVPALVIPDDGAPSS
jgi:nucleotide-binding universal stress UspA family protein